jgi:hypothetical protein
MAVPSMYAVIDDAVAALRAAVKREAVDVVAKKVTDDAAVAVDKKAADAAMDEEVAPDAVAVEGATLKVAFHGMVDSSPAPMAGAKRAVVSDGSTPLTKRQFRGSWKPRYVVGHYVCPSFLYVYFISLGFFVVQRVSLQQDTYPRS